MAKLYPDSIQNLIERFAELPGIGARSAERMAFYILASARDEAMSLAIAIRDVKKNIRACKRCFNVAEHELCHICSDYKRDNGLICVVELPRDIIALEKCGGYNGEYHVLQGRLEPSSGVGPEQLRIQELIARVAEPEVREVILALNPTTEGDITAAYLIELISGLDKEVTITRLARGLASGTDLEATAPSSLEYAFKGRQRV